MFNSTTLSNLPSEARRPALVDRAWFNAVWFQTFWFVCVLGREQWLPLAVSMILLHLWLARPWVAELQHLLPVATVGIAADAVLSLTGAYQFSGEVLVPAWLCVLWLGFAAALPRSLGFLLPRPWLAVACGAIALPLNYLAGAKLGAVEYGFDLSSTVALQALLWAALLPALTIGSRRPLGKRQ